jgi:cysteinyl-tRNA synthetase
MTCGRLGADMAIEIYNTETKKLEEFKPIEDGKVSMYVCGPTVYNLIHIGNARPMIVFDTVRRYFEYKGYQVNYVSNFTDVDDKIIKKANEEGVDSAVISERYIQECKKDMADLNVRPATTHPQATQEIQGMIDMIQTLIDKGYAYVVDDGTVYFSVRQDRSYGKLSHKNLNDLQFNMRGIAVSGEDQKKDPLDFVLWKPKKEGEPYWESPWCQGRPGWHIECSVMSRKYLGETIDIHAGGEDLIFPHHENEIAQSECANGKPFVHYWMHNAFLNIDNHKMSKSLGNFKTVRDINAQYDPQILRYLMLSAHYRSPLNFSADLMEAARASYERIVTCMENLNFRIGNAQETGSAGTGDEQAIRIEAQKCRQEFEKAMDDDFNTADALAGIFDLVKVINTGVTENTSPELMKELKQELNELCGVLGLIAERENTATEDETAWVENMIEQRAAAKKAKDYAKADAIRDELKAKGIVLEDTREGVKWKKN